MQRSIDNIDTLRLLFISIKSHCHSNGITPMNSIHCGVNIKRRSKNRLWEYKKCAAEKKDQRPEQVQFHTTSIASNTIKNAFCSHTKNPSRGGR
jgi:hypothetical protein